MARGKRPCKNGWHFVCAVLNQFELLYLYTVVGLHLLTLGVVISQRKMLAHHHEQDEPTTTPAVAVAAAQDGR